MTATRQGRLVGLDVARCLALLGMVATHVLDARAPDGELATAQWLAGGRASALFAVLAGVSLALMTRKPLRGRPRAVRALGILGRAVLVALLGLALGGLDSGLAVILTSGRSCRSPSRGWSSPRWSRTWSARTCRSAATTTRRSLSWPSQDSWPASCS